MSDQDLTNPVTQHASKSKQRLIIRNFSPIAIHCNRLWFCVQVLQKVYYMRSVVKLEHLKTGLPPPVLTQATSNRPGSKATKAEKLAKARAAYKRRKDQLELLSGIDTAGCVREGLTALCLLQTVFVVQRGSIGQLGYCVSQLFMHISGPAFVLMRFSRHVQIAYMSGPVHLGCRPPSAQHPLAARVADAQGTQNPSKGAVGSKRAYAKAARGSRMWAEHEDRFILQCWCRCDEAMMCVRNCHYYSGRCSLFAQLVAQDTHASLLLPHFASSCMELHAWVIMDKPCPGHC